MSRFIINGLSVSPPEGIVVANYIDNGEPHFKSKLRKKKLQHFVLHETAGPTAQGCKNTLLKKGYGVQLIMDRSGRISQHGDLLRDQMVHANQLNSTSIGIEIVNPYAPSLAKGVKNVKFLPAEWWTWCIGGDRRYVCPTDAQLEVLYTLVPWVCRQLEIPIEFPTRNLGPKKRRVFGWQLRAKPESGIVAHQDFSSHSDGRFPLEYLYKRLEVNETSNN